MVRKIRIFLATLFFVGITLMFLDFTGTIHVYLDWMASLQFWPALLGLSIIPLLIVIVLTLVFGRIYCSVICPMGVFQDIIARIGRIGKRNPYRYSKAKTKIRLAFLVVMVALFPLGLTSLLAPYSAFGRIATTLFRPLWIWGNNLLAGIAEHYDSYLFYRADVLFVGGVTLIIAVVTLVVVGILAFRGGRTYCNTVCPVGTILGYIGCRPLVKMTIDTDKCRNCGKCGKNCKSACIDTKNHKIDYTRCVVCGDCIGKCEFDAIHYTTKGSCKKEEKKTEGDATDLGRRGALVGMAIATTTAALAQEKKKVDGGLAVIEDKQAPARKTPILPPGARSWKHMSHHCTACQLCVSACENKVLRPSTDIHHLMQPVMSYEHGYCRPECHACSSVCPANAIENIGVETKASTKIGTAVFIKKNCVALEGEWECGNCARHCPTGAIEMVPSDPDDESSPLMPAVDETRCIGCGACENLCPARPFSAIYVEGLEIQKEI